MVKFSLSLNKWYDFSAFYTYTYDTPTITNKVSQGHTPFVLEALLLLFGLPLVLTLRKFVELEALAELQNITVP